MMQTTRVRRWIGVAVAIMAVSMVACGDGEDGESGGDRVITIMAPAPLTKYLEQAKTEFEADNPDVSVQLNFAHVPALLTQIESGVAADVLVTTDAGSMKVAAEKGLLATDATVVGRIPLALIVPVDNPASVTAVTALADPELTVAVCALELPCGQLTEQLAEGAGITVEADTREVGGSPAIVTKASTGEIDVGVVLATDVAAGGDSVTQVAIPADLAVLSDVSAATLNASENQTVAEAFVAFLESPQGRELAESSGMGF